VERFYNPLATGEVRLMSEVGQTRSFSDVGSMSGLPPQADLRAPPLPVSDVPHADILPPAQLPTGPTITVDDCRSRHMPHHAEANASCPGWCWTLPPLAHSKNRFATGLRIRLRKITTAIGQTAVLRARDCGLGNARTRAGA
jgi:hypothetical protein